MWDDDSGSITPGPESYALSDTDGDALRSTTAGPEGYALTNAGDTDSLSFGADTNALRDSDDDTGYDAGTATLVATGSALRDTDDDTTAYRGDGAADGSFSEDEASTKEPVTPLVSSTNRYTGEDKDRAPFAAQGLWVSQEPGVTSRTYYMSAEEREDYRLGVNADGLLVDSDGNKANTRVESRADTYPGSIGGDLFVLDQGGLFGANPTDLLQDFGGRKTEGAAPGAAMPSDPPAAPAPLPSSYHVTQAAPAVDDSSFSLSDDDDTAAGPRQFVDSTHHSTLAAGQRGEGEDTPLQVYAAGEIIAEDGQVRAISDASGHFRPSTKQTRQLVDALEGAKANLDNAKINLVGKRDRAGAIPSIDVYTGEFKASEGDQRTLTKKRTVMREIKDAGEGIQDRLRPVPEGERPDDLAPRVATTQTDATTVVNAAAAADSPQAGTTTQTGGRRRADSRTDADNAGEGEDATEDGADAPAWARGTKPAARSRAGVTVGAQRGRGTPAQTGQMGQGAQSATPSGIQIGARRAQPQTDTPSGVQIGARRGPRRGQ